MNELLDSALGEHAPAAIDFAIKATALLLFAGMVSVCLRKAAAALRHLVWFIAVLGTLLLPLMQSRLPAWEVSWIPDWEETLDYSTQPVVNAPITVPTPKSEPLPSSAADPEPIYTAISEEYAFVPAPAVTAPPSVNWPQAIWLTGSLLCLMPFAIGFWRLQRMTNRAEPIRHDLNENIAFATNKIGVRRFVAVLASREIRMPLTWGFARPVILVPEEFADWSDGRREMVLMHELAHIKRNDWLTQLLAGIVAALYWFHPLVWLAARQMRVEREQACDDLVIRAGSRPSDYADELLKIATSLGKSRWLNPVAVPMARKSSLEGRLLAILDGSRKRRAVTRWVMAAAFVGLLSVVVPIAMLQSAEEALEPKELSTADVQVDSLIKAAVRMGFKRVNVSQADGNYHFDLEDTVISGRSVRLATNNGLERIVIDDAATMTKGGTNTISGDRLTISGVSDFRMEGNVVSRVIAFRSPLGLFVTTGVLTDPPNRNRMRWFVRLVLEPEQMTLEGKSVSDDQIRTRLNNIPDRKNTVLELAISTDALPLRRVNEFQFKYGALARELGFEYASFIGVQAAGSRGSPAAPRAVEADSKSAGTTPWETVNKWLALVRQMKPKGQWPEEEKKATWDALWDLTTRDSAAAPSVDTQRLWQLKSIRPAFQVGGKDVAMVVTHPYQDNAGRSRVFNFLLQKKDDKWLIARADYGSLEDAEKRVEGFRMHPGMRYDVPRESLVGDWLLVFFSPSYLTHHANGELEVSYRGTNGSMVTNVGTWSIQGDVYTQMIDGKKSTGRISSLTQNSFHYKLPNGNTIGYERRKNQSTRREADRLNEERLKLARQQLDEIKRLHQRGLASDLDLTQAELKHQMAKEPWNGTKTVELSLKLKELQMKQAREEQAAKVAAAREKVEAIKELIDAGRARSSDLTQAEYDLAAAEEPWNITRLVQKQLEIKTREVERARALAKADRMPRSQLDQLQAEHRKLIDQFKNLVSPDLGSMARSGRPLTEGSAVETRRLITLYSALKGEALWNTLSSASKDRQLDSLLQSLNALQTAQVELQQRYQPRHPKMLETAMKVELMEKELDKRSAAILKAMEITAKAQEAAAKVRMEKGRAVSTVEMFSTDRNPKNQLTGLAKTYRGVMQGVNELEKTSTEFGQKKEEVQRHLSSAFAKELHRIVEAFRQYDSSKRRFHVPDLWNALALATDDPQLNESLSAFHSEQRTSAELQKRYLATHPHVVKSKQSLELLKGRIGERCEAILESMELTAKGLEAAGRAAETVP